MLYNNLVSVDVVLIIWSRPAIGFFLSLIVFLNHGWHILSEFVSCSLKWGFFLSEHFDSSVRGHDM